MEIQRERFESHTVCVFVMIHDRHAFRLPVLLSNRYVYVLLDTGGILNYAAFRQDYTRKRDKGVFQYFERVFSIKTDETYIAFTNTAQECHVKDFTVLAQGNLLWTTVFEVGKALFDDYGFKVLLEEFFECFDDILSSCQYRLGDESGKHDEGNADG